MVCCLALSAIDDTTLERNKIIVLMLIFPSSESLKFSETGSSDATSFLRSRGTIKSSVVLGAQRNPNDLRAWGCTENDTQHGSKLKKVWLSDDNIYM